MHSLARDFVRILLGALSLFSVTLFNGFPLLSPDTIFYTYFAKLTRLELSMLPVLYRPVTYSIFLFATHSLAWAAFLQGLWLSSLIFEVGSLLGLRGRVFPLVMLAATVFTPIAICSNFILPDVFLPIQLLSFFCLLYWPRYSKKKRVWLGFTFLFASMSHYSNVILCLVGLLGVALKGRRKVLLALLAGPFLLVTVLHAGLLGRVGWFDAGNVYLFSRLDALELAGPYLEERCHGDVLGICRVPKEGFPIWDRSSASLIFQFGGMGQILPEIERTNWEILTRPRLLFYFLILSARNVAEQLILLPRPLEPALQLSALHEPSPEVVAAFHAQALRGVAPAVLADWVDGLGVLYLAVTMLSLGALAWLRPALSAMQIRFFALLGVVLFLNAVICGTLTEPAARYQLRIIFLIPLFLFYCWMGRGPVPAHDRRNGIFGRTWGKFFRR